MLIVVLEECGADKISSLPVNNPLAVLMRKIVCTFKDCTYNILFLEFPRRPQHHYITQDTYAIYFYPLNPIKLKLFIVLLAPQFLLIYVPSWVIAA